MTRFTPYVVGTVGLGLGLMGMHEWLLKRGHKYEVNDDLKEWLWLGAYRVSLTRLLRT